MTVTVLLLMGIILLSYFIGLETARTIERNTDIEALLETLILMQGDGDDDAEEPSEETYDEIS
ncbi:MAG: hypothetical protein IJ234_00570 [Clostridia bacterium]|nr:hypothetical protein [Clostridia bacterium]